MIEIVFWKRLMDGRRFLQRTHANRPMMASWFFLIARPGPSVHLCKILSNIGACLFISATTRLQLKLVRSWARLLRRNEAPSSEHIAFTSNVTSLATSLITCSRQTGSLKHCLAIVHRLPLASSLPYFCLDGMSACHWLAITNCDLYKRKQQTFK